MITHNN